MEKVIKAIRVPSIFITLDDLKEYQNGTLKDEFKVNGLDNFFNTYYPNKTKEDFEEIFTERTRFGTQYNIPYPEIGFNVRIY